MWNCIKGCLSFLFFLIIALILFILFDWLDARDVVEAAINWQGDALVTLSNWGDDLQEVIDATLNTADQAGETLQKAEETLQQSGQ